MDVIMDVMVMKREASSECEVVGEGMADIAGIGIIVGFVGQALISLSLACWVFFLSKYGNLDVKHAEGSVEHEIEQKRLESVSDILMVGNDIQMLLGSSYMISIFVMADTIDLYHLHLAFDIASFVGVSNAAALVCWTFCNIKMTHRKTPSRSAHFTPRHRAAYLFAAMFFTLTVILCLRLDEWDPDEEPGRCYYTHLITRPNVQHPQADKIYVIVTASWMLLVMLAAAFFGARWRRPVLVLAFLQFPVHLYMALALRTANQGKLSGEETHENGWDFGQTTAVILLAVAVRELLNKGYEFIIFERDLRKRGLQKSVGGGSQLQVRDPVGMEEEIGSYGAGGNAYDEREPLAMPSSRVPQHET